MLTGYSDEIFESAGTGRTHGGWVLAEVLGLVLSEEALCLDLWSSSTWELLVKAHNALHADSILSSTEALFSVSVVRSWRILRIFVVVLGCVRQGGYRIAWALRRGEDRSLTEGEATCDIC